jgi:hypothetical protein
MTATEETTATPLVNVASVVDRVRAAAKAEYLRLDPTYSWTPATIEELLIDQGEPVYSFGGMVLVDEGVAEKLFSFFEDFLIPERPAAPEAYPGLLEG